MSEKITNSSLVVDRTISGSAEKLNEIITTMSCRTTILLKQIKKLEEDLARDKKMKAGFKVLINSLDSENKMLKARVLKKSKKRQISQSESKNVRENQPETTAILSQPSRYHHDHSYDVKSKEQKSQTDSSKCQTDMVTDEIISSTDHSIVQFERTGYELTDTPSNGDFVEISSHSAGSFSSQNTRPISSATEASQNNHNKICEKSMEKIQNLTSKLEETENKMKEAVEKSQMLEIQMETYKADFMSERADRERAMGKIMELEKQLTSSTKRSESSYHRDHPPSYVLHSGSLDMHNSHKTYCYGPTSVPNRDDVLIARGPHLDRKGGPYTKPSVTYPYQYPQENLKIPVQVSNDDKYYINQSDSSESLNLLTTELGGDDYCR